jgi:hypothetical protein
MRIGSFDFVIKSKTDLVENHVKGYKYHLLWKEEAISERIQNYQWHSSPPQDSRWIFEDTQRFFGLCRQKVEVVDVGVRSLKNMFCIVL